MVKAGGANCSKRLRALRLHEHEGRKQVFSMDE